MLFLITFLAYRVMNKHYTPDSDLLGCCYGRFMLYQHFPTWSPLTPAEATGQNILSTSKMWCHFKTYSLGVISGLDC